MGKLPITCDEAATLWGMYLARRYDLEFGVPTTTPAPFPRVFRPAAGAGGAHAAPARASAAAAPRVVVPGAPAGPRAVRHRDVVRPVDTDSEGEEHEALVATRGSKTDFVRKAHYVGLAAALAAAGAAANWETIMSLINTYF